MGLGDCDYVTEFSVRSQGIYHTRPSDSERKAWIFNDSHVTVHGNRNLTDTEQHDL